jgi:hypothetical protein
MSPEEFEKLPIIALGDTTYNDPTGYTEIQKFFLPYIETYHAFLWICFFGVLLTLITRFIILPLMKKDKKDKPAKSANTGEKQNV